MFREIICDCGTHGGEECIILMKQNFNYTRTEVPVENDIKAGVIVHSPKSDYITDSKFLLVFGLSGWGFPKGSMEQNGLRIDAKQEALRELQEETGIVLTKDELYKEVSIYNDKFFYAEMPQTTLVKVEDHISKINEIGGYAWVNIHCMLRLRIKTGEKLGKLLVEWMLRSMFKFDSKLNLSVPELSSVCMLRFERCENLMKPVTSFISSLENINNIGKYINIQEWNLENNSNYQNKLQSLQSSILNIKNSLHLHTENSRSYHNYVKKQLISLCLENRDVLDIGPGKGGDLMKYYHAGIKTLHGLEPNKEFLREFNQRLSSISGFRDKVSTTNINAENYSCGAPLFNAATSFFSLSFFFETEDKLDRLIRMVSSNLSSENSVFIGTTIDSIFVKELFSYKNSSKVVLSNDTIVIEKKYSSSTLSGYSNPFGQKILFQFRGSATLDYEQTEYLVDWDLFVKKMSDVGFILMSSERFKPSSTLTPDDQTFSELYRYFVFVRLPTNVTSINLHIPKYKYYLLQKLVNLYSTIVPEKERERLVEHVPLPVRTEPKTSTPVVVRAERNTSSIVRVVLTNNEQKAKDVYIKIFNTEKFVGNMPRRLERKDILKLREYAFTPKLDGVRYLLILMNGESVIVDRNMTFKDVNIKNNVETTILDCELYKGVFYVFDCLYANGVSTLDLPLKERLINAKKVVGSTKSLKLKKFHYEDVLTQAKDFWESDHQGVEYDGIIFSPTDEGYFSSKHYKWKDTFTVDLLFKNNGWFARDKKGLVLVSLNYEPTASTSTKIKSPISLTSGQIYEIDLKNNVVIRHRTDRSDPNAILTVETEIKAKNDNLTLDEIIKEMEEDVLGIVTKQSVPEIVVPIQSVPEMKEVVQPRKQNAPLLASLSKVQKHEPSTRVSSKYPQIQGLVYQSNFLTKEEQNSLLKKINEQEWSSALDRKTQHYGYVYDYRASVLRPAEPIPDWLDFVLERLHSLEYFTDKMPDQVIVNHYEPGQGISAHTDHKSLFGDRVVSISLGSMVVMTFEHPDGRKVDVPLEVGSAVLLNEESRYVWTHSIAKRKSDVVNGKKILRGERVSLTFRFRK